MRRKNKETALVPNQCARLENMKIFSHLEKKEGRIKSYFFRISISDRSGNGVRNVVLLICEVEQWLTWSDAQLYLETHRRDESTN